MIAMTCADRRLYLVRADGTVLLADASPESFQLRGKLQLPDHEQAIGATLPVVTGGRLYIRDNDHLFCYDVRENSQPATARIVELGEPVSRVSPTVSERGRAKNKQPDAIFVPTPHDVVAKMLELAAVRKSDTVYDLGSGDGRIVIAAAKTYGANAVGIELDKQLVVNSRENVEKAGLAARVRIDHADIFQQDLKDADVIALYLPPQLMDRLLPQLEKLKPGTRIVSHYFKFTDIEPAASLRYESSDDGDVHDLHLWTAPLRAAVP
jgi:precorrin-6B methylase 2